MHDEGEEEEGGKDLFRERQGSTKNLQFSVMANETLCLVFTQLPFFGTTVFNYTSFYLKYCIYIIKYSSTTFLFMSEDLS